MQEKREEGLAQTTGGQLAQHNYLHSHLSNEIMTNLATIASQSQK